MNCKKYIRGKEHTYCNLILQCDGVYLDCMEIGSCPVFDDEYFKQVIRREGTKYE